MNNNKKTRYCVTCGLDVEYNEPCACTEPPTELINSDELADIEEIEYDLMMYGY